MMLKTLYRFLFGTLRGRLIIGVAAVHAVMMTLFICDLTARQRAMLLDRQIEEATALSQALATSAAGWIAADDISGMQELVEAQRRYPEVLFAILADREGRVLADTDKSRQGFYMLDLPRETRRTVLSGTPALVDVAVPAIIGGSHVGWARVGIGQKATGAKLAEITRDGVVYALAAILIGSAIAWFMGRRITDRLYAVQETIDKVRSGDRLARSSLAGTDEAAVMAREFNAMLDALAERDAELRESEEKYRTIFQNSPLGIFRSSFEGRFLDVNQATAKILGYDSPEAVIREIYNIAEQIYVHTGDRQRIVSEQLDSGDITTHYLNRFRRKDGSEFIANLYLKTIHDAEGRPNYLQGIVEDITEQKKAEAEIQRLNAGLEQRVAERTAQLEAANRELEAFCYSVSHDLRAPLRHIDGYVDLLVSRCRDGLTDKGVHYVDTIAASARQMGVLIDDLLQFSRTGRAEMRRESLDMNQALQEAMTLLKESYAGRPIEWVIGELPSVKGDYPLLRQVWANLLGNAVKYTRQREAARIEVSAREGEGEIIFAVADNGVGFDMQYAGKLFGVFQRLHSQEEFEGTGIGLATVRRIITRHGGRVWAEAELDRGATFYFTLPNPNEPEPKKISRGDAENAGETRIKT